MARFSVSFWRFSGVFLGFAVYFFTLFFFLFSSRQLSVSVHSDVALACQQAILDASPKGRPYSSVEENLALAIAPASFATAGSVNDSGTNNTNRSGITSISTGR